MPVYIPYDGNLDLGRFLTSDIASVEVSKGYSSLLQGPNQMGGAINITTKKPTKPIEGSIGYRQGWSRSKDNAHDMHASFGASNDLGYIQLSGSQLKQDFLGLPHGVDNPVAGSHGKIANSSADDKRGIVKLGFTPRGDDEYVLTYINQDGEKITHHMPGPAVRNHATGNGHSTIKRAITIRAPPIWAIVSL